MIRLRIKDLCREKAIAHDYTALTKAGISKEKAMQYLDGKTNRLMLDDVETLCNLLRCTPNDLLQWSPGKKTEDYPENPLQVIRKKPPIVLEEILKEMTVGEVREFVEMREEKKRRSE